MESNPPEIEKDLLAEDREPDNGHPKKVVYIEESSGESDDSLKTIFDNVNAVIVRLNKYGKIIETNAKAEDCFGHKREEIIGKHFAMLGVFSMKELPKLMKLFSDAVKGKINTYSDELEAIDKNGHKILIKLYSSIVKKDGKMDGVICIIHDITSQKQAEEARRESEDKYKTIFDNINEVIIRIDKSGRIIEANPQVKNFFGYNREYLIGKHFSKLGILSIKDLPHLIISFSDILRGKITNYHQELETKDKAGNKIIVDVNSAIIKKDGKIDGTVSLVSNVTERRKNEAALRESEQTFSKVFQASPNPICIVSIEGETFIDINESYSRFTGYTREETIGHTSKEINLCLNENDLKTMQSILMQKGRMDNHQFASRTKSGEIRTGLFSAEIINISGKLCMILVVTDITEQKWAEDALKESEEFTSSLLTNTPIPIFVANPDSSIKYVNPAFEKLTGFNMTDVVGMKTPYPWWPEESKEEINNTVKLGTSMSNLKREMSYRKKSGETFWVELTPKVIKQDGAVKYILINWVDITERKQMEEALRFSDAAFKSIHESVIAVDNARTITYFNNISEQLFGITASEAIGRKLKDVIKPVEEYPGQDQERIQKISTQGYSRNELLYMTPRGPVWVDTTIQVMKEGDKKYGYIMTAQDITGRKQAEKATHDSEEKFSKAFSAASDAMAICSYGGTFLEVNDHYIKLSGYSQEELVGSDADKLNMWGNPADRTRMLHLMRDEGHMNNEEFAFRTKSGDVRTCLFSSESINVGGERRMIIVVQDITERKKMESALRESKEKFFKAFNTSANAISINRIKDSRFIEANESFSRFTGYTHDEVIGHDAGELNLWVKREEQQKGMEALEKDGRVYNQEFSSRCKSGEIRVGLSSIETLNIGGEPCRMIVITDITKRKKAEEALKDSEEKFSKAFNASANAIGITSLKTNLFIEVNESFTRFTGYSREELIGHNAIEFNFWVNEEELKKWGATLQAEGRAYNQEISSRIKSGEIRIGLYSADKINIGGEPCRIVMITDITERKKAEENLRLLSSVTQQVTDSIVVNDPDFKITYMNKAAQNLFGYSIDEVMGKNISLFDGVPFSKRSRKDIRNAINLGKTWTAVLTKRHKDGSTFLCDCRRSPLFDEDGCLVSYIAVYRDITEQKETEAKLQAQKKMVESILTSMPEGVLVTDSSDLIILANESFRKIFRTGRRIIETKLLNDVLGVEQLFDLYTSIKTGNTDVHSLEFRYKVKDTEKIITSGIIKMDSERMLLIFSDVSREREEEDKLYLSDRLASLGEMAAGMAHELNNPLTGILTLSQLLVNSDMPAEQKEDLQCVYSEAKRAANIVKNVLLFTRNNSYENGTSSANEVVKEVLRLREHEDKMKNINVVTNFQDNLAEIQLDKYQLQQVFLNIILNAEAAIEEAKRPGTLTITTERVNNHVNIIFSDNGCGIKKQVLPRIFDPFFTTKEIGKGTGLGLSICYGIIVKHNGKITVKTQVGQGTTFTIRMPIANQ